MLRSLAAASTRAVLRQNVSAPRAQVLMLKALESTSTGETKQEKKPTIWKIDEEKRQKLAAFGKYCAECMPRFVQRVQFAAGDELELLIHPEGVKPVVQFVKNHHGAQFTNISCITAVDVPTRENRFEVIYQFLSVRFNARIRLRTYTDEINPLDSITDIFYGADWYEREVYDMYGVWFNGHKDLRRILTDYGFEGHPMRKDYPLTGYEEVRFDPELKHIVYEPVELAQEFRKFDLDSAWEPFPAFRNTSITAGYEMIDDREKSQETVEAK